MGSDWKHVKLGDIAENASRPFDFSNRNQVVFINTGDVLHGKFLHSNKTPPINLPGQAKKESKRTIFYLVKSDLKMVDMLWWILIQTNMLYQQNSWLLSVFLKRQILIFFIFS